MSSHGTGWDKLVTEGAVRLTIGIPRRIPRRYREGIVDILAQELMGHRQVVDVRRHAARHGALHLILRELRASSEWGRLRDISGRSDALAALALSHVSRIIFDVLDHTIDLPGTASARCRFIDLVDLTLEVWRQGTEDEALARGVDDIMSSDAFGDVSDLLDEIIRMHLSPIVEELELYLRMISQMRELLPLGGEGAEADSMLLEYIDKIDRHAELMRRSDELQRILDLMGRLDMEYGDVSRETRRFLTSEAYDIGMSRDVQHVLPMELLKLKVPILRTLFMSQMLEGRLLTYRLHGLDRSPEPIGRGPVIALIDASGSMSGEPELFAKAFILMLAKRMEREGRMLNIILFAAEDWKLELDLTDRKKAAKSLLDTICRHFEGNTNFNSALRTGLEVLRRERRRGTDVLFFTDGESKVTDDALVSEWRELHRSTGARIFTLIVGSDQAGGLEAISDKTWMLPTSSWDPGTGPSSLIRTIAKG